MNKAEQATKKKQQKKYRDNTSGCCQISSIYLLLRRKLVGAWLIRIESPTKWQLPPPLRGIKTNRRITENHLSMQRCVTSIATPTLKATPAGSARGSLSLSFSLALVSCLTQRNQRAVKHHKTLWRTRLQLIGKSSTSSIRHQLRHLQVADFVMLCERFHGNFTGL